MVVLMLSTDPGHAGDLACRWNCKAGKCGSCSAEINGVPKLMCMTRMSTPTISRSPSADAGVSIVKDRDGRFVELRTENAN